MLALAVVALAAGGCGSSSSSSTSAKPAGNQPARGFQQGSGKPVAGKRKVSAGVKTATATFSVGSGMDVSVVGGGGGGKSFCTKDESSDSFKTKGDNERHDFGFYAKGDGSCAFNVSYSYFAVKVKDAAGKVVGSGDMWLGQTALYGYYYVTCGPQDSFAGVKCEVTGDRYSGRSLKISRA